jgi:endonuclease/exonuclease/phosphatase family metal-dependent hydrolase
MRNGGPNGVGEDRGNAILSSRPLTDLSALVLPLERQRRVAVMATIAGRSPAGGNWTLRMVTVHLSNFVGHHLWLFSEAARMRQARSLIRAIDDDTPTVLGGDLNAWFGTADGAYQEIARRFDPVVAIDPRPTRGVLRLDHQFFRLPAGSRVTVRRADDRYGSDHYPLVATVVFAAGRLSPLQ